MEAKWESWDPEGVSVGSWVSGLGLLLMSEFITGIGLEGVRASQEAEFGDLVSLSLL